jgi:hypothetical protein
MLSMDSDGTHSPDKEQAWIEKYRAALDTKSSRPSRISRAGAVVRGARRAVIAGIGRIFKTPNDLSLHNGATPDTPRANLETSARPTEKKILRATNREPSNKTQGSKGGESKAS